MTQPQPYKTPPNRVWSIASTAGYVAGNQSMRKGKRESWNEEDYDIARQTFDDVMARLCPDRGRTGE